MLGCSGWLQSVQSGFYHVANGSGYNILGGCQDVVEWLLGHAGWLLGCCWDALGGCKVFRVVFSMLLTVVAITYWVVVRMLLSGC